MTKEERAKEREKQLAALKASNEMLEQAKNTAIKHGGVEESVLKAIDTAKTENLQHANKYYGATPDEVSEAQYHGASVAWVKKYQEHLDKRGMTDEQVYQKELAVASVTPADYETPKFNRTEKGVGYVGDNEEIPSLDDLVEEKKPKRRTRKKKAEEEKPETVKEEKLETTNIKIAAPADNVIKLEKQDPVVVNNEEEKTSDTYNVEDFNLSDIPDYVQYDMIPLPSNGECYKHKKSRIPVAYLTASDENIIASPNMYRDGKLLDVILRRKILDKTINVDDLCSGDRDAIILWLRATAYGADFPIVATHPQTRKQYSLSINLGDFKYFDFKLKSNENALFEYKTEGGDLIEFKFLSNNEEEILRKKIAEQAVNSEKMSAIKYLNNLRESITKLPVSEDDMKHFTEDAEEILEIIGTDFPEMPEFSNSVTEQMIAHTVAVNGNRDREYIKGYIENMRTKDSYAYRMYFTDNRPGVDFTFTVNVPESDGGGSFDTFLRLDDTIFINF